MNEHDATEIAFKNGYDKAVKEIFEDIEETISSLEYRAKSERKTIYLEKMTEVVNWVLHEVVPNRIAELKKKYTGEK